MERQKIKVTRFAASIFTYRVRSHLEAALGTVWAAAGSDVPMYEVGASAWVGTVPRASMRNQPGKGQEGRRRRSWEGTEPGDSFAGMRAVGQWPWTCHPHGETWAEWPRRGPE